MLSLQVSSQKIRFADHKHALQFLHVLHWLRVNKSKLLNPLTATVHHRGVKKKRLDKRLQFRTMSRCSHTSSSEKKTLPGTSACCPRSSKVSSLVLRASGSLCSLTRHLERSRKDRRAKAHSAQGRAHRSRGMLGRAKVLWSQAAHPPQWSPQQGKARLPSPSPPGRLPLLKVAPETRRPHRAPAQEMQHRQLHRTGPQLLMLASGM